MLHFSCKDLQPISFLGLEITLLGLNATQNPNIVVAWLTVEISLSSFSQDGFIINMYIGLLS